MRIALCALAALTLSACQKADGTQASAPAAEATASDAAGAASPLTVSAPQLAYAYSYALATPAKAVRGLMSRHESACWDAGPAVCQVTGSSLTEDGPDHLAGTLTLRAQPAWLRAFRQGLEGQAEAAGGRLLSATTESDDLSRTIVDTEAALRARTLLRDRLEATLRTRDAKVSELFEMERQLAQVQGEIDAARSQLAIMRTRVATSELRIDYRSEGVLAPRGTFAPLGQAAADAVGLAVVTLAFLIRAAAVATPLAGVVALAWLMTRSLRRKPARRTPAA